MRKPTNMIQAPMITLLVSSEDTTSTGPLVGTGSALNVNNGEVAMVSSDLDAPDYGQVTATPDGYTVKLIQGTPKSNNIADTDPWGVADPAIVETDSIYKDGVRSITTANYNSGALAMSAFTDVPDIAANSEYGVIVELGGVRQDREFGENVDQPTGSVNTTADLPAEPKDFVLQSIASKLNYQSRLTSASKNYVVLGINTAGGSGTALAGITNDNGTVDFLLKDGITYNVQTTTQFVRGLANLIEASASITGASTIEVMDVTTAGETAKVDALVVVGLDGALAAYEDDVASRRTDVNINPKDEFENEGTVEKAYPIESQGDGRSLSLKNRDRAQLQIHTKQRTPYMEYFSEGYSYLDKSKNYGTTYINFIGKESTVDHEYTYEKQAIVFWEQSEPTTLTVGTLGTEVNNFTPTETAPAVVAQFAAWADNVSVVTV